MSDSYTIGDAQRCPSCGAANNCAIAQGAEQCWCMTEPITAPLPTSTNTSNIDGASCYCQRCLQNLASAKKPRAENAS